MEVLTVLLNNAALSPILAMDDVARLLCVSKEVRNCVFENELHHETNKNVIIATAHCLECIKTQHLLEDHCVNLPFLFRIILQIRTLYGNIKKTKELIDVLEILTGQTAKKIIRLDINTDIKKQETTLHCLVDIFHKNSTAHNTIVMYVFMNFVKRLVTSSLPKKKNVILGDRQFRTLIHDRCTANIRQIREQVTSFPFGFLEKVIRQSTETRRSLSFYE